MSRNNKKQKLFSSGGFTLVEMLVSIAVFMSVMVVATGSLVSIIHENDKAQVIKSVVDNLTFAVDSISRNLRTGTDYACKTSASDVSFLGDCPNGGELIHYKAPDLTYTQYKFVNTVTAASTGMGNIQRQTGCNQTGDSCTGTWQSITAPTQNVNVSVMTFYVLGTVAPNQPRVIITADGFIKASDGGASEFTIQTTASQRSRN